MMCGIQNHGMCVCVYAPRACVCACVRACVCVCVCVYVRAGVPDVRMYVCENTDTIASFHQSRRH